MENLFPLLIAVVVVLLLIVFLSLISGSKKTQTRKVAAKDKKSAKKFEGNEKKYIKNRNQVIRDCSKKLGQNPHDVWALKNLGNLYYDEGIFDKAYPLFQTLSKLAAVNKEIDVLDTSLKTGICAAKLSKWEDTVRSLSVAYKFNPKEYDTNFYLGQACLELKEYEKAVMCFKRAAVLNPEATALYFYLGKSLYKGNLFHESLPYLKKSLDLNPDNKETLFLFANAMSEDGQGEKALKVFSHLRPDPVFGARSCLAAGMLHARSNKHEEAIQDFEIGLRHQNVPLDTKLEIQYRLATSLIALNQLSKGLTELKSINLTNPNYKDVGVLINRYQELSQNTNLQVYLTSGSSDFVALCRKIVLCMNKDSNVKFQNISVEAAFTEIVATVENAKWEEVEIFRFFRTTGVTGELYLRDLHGQIHDVKADKGICVTAGQFSEEAHKFTEGRLIDLVEKPELTKFLKQIPS